MKRTLFPLLFLLFLLSCNKDDGNNPITETDPESELTRLYFTTQPGAMITRESYIPAILRLEPNAEYNTGVLEADVEIRGRGNSTWSMPKKPYKIKFKSKTSLLGMPEHKTWVLLANYADKSLMRNFLAYNLAKDLEMPFAPSSHFMEVFLNGIHQGNYMLSDQIEVASTRVDIPELESGDNDAALSEVFKNVDSKSFSSIYFYKNRGGKLSMGPIWDFDLAAGNARHCGECMYPTGWYVKNNPWFNRMYEDPEFKAQVKSLWNQYKAQIDAVLPKIEEMSTYLDLSQKKNFTIWPKFGDPDWTTVQGKHTYESHVDYLHSFLKDRISWMDQEINK